MDISDFRKMIKKLNQGTFLHTHPGMERRKGILDGHVIVDGVDLLEAKKALRCCLETIDAAAEELGL
jgi:hypothetical protein